jgi:ATP-dependent Clp protease protease subunit
MSEIKQVINYDLSDKFQLEDLADRKLYINCDIDESITDDIVYHIFRFNTEDKGKPLEDRKPILLYVTSHGGDVDDGFGLIDTILVSKTPVYTINFSYQYSMGFLIGLAGVKRFATKNAKFLMHDGQNFVWNSSSKVKDQIKFQEQIEERIKQYVLSRSKLTSKEYDEKLRVEWYLFADQAKEKGFTDFIIGEDCDIDLIV